MSDQSQPAAVVARRRFFLPISALLLGFLFDYLGLECSEARSIHAGLKTLLARDVWGNYREADFQRKNLRRRYLHLLLLHPTAREARDAGTHLWMQTSYAFIALYKQRLARPHNNNNTNANANNNTGGGGGNNTNGSQVETRKLLQRFRQFLADEERFWRALVLRVRRAPVYSAALPPAEDLAYALPPELLSNGGEDGGDGGGGGSVEERMNHFGFPAAPGPASSTQDGTGVEVMPTAVDEATARSVLSKALVCLGDIARYREQYKAPPPNPKPKNLGLGPGVVRGKTPFEPRPNYGRARSLYLAAHALAPAEGNAAHQLAILAGYESDTLSSLSWYLRALCVRAPFDTAGENLAGVLARVLAGQRQAKSSANVGGGGGKHAQQQDGHHKGKEAKDATSVIDLDALAAKWLSARERDRGADTGIEGVEGGGGAEDDEKEKEEDEKDPPRVRIERFKRAVVLLHALWRDPGAAHATPAYALALAAHIARAFARLVAARALPEELIVRVVLCAQGAVWAGRMRVGVGAGVSANSNTSANGNGSGEGEGEKQLGAGVGAEKGAGAEKEKGRRRRDRYRDRDRDRSSTTPVTASAPTTATLPVPAPQSNTNTKTQKAHLAHLFALHTALLGVGVRELGEVDMYSAPAALASSTMGMGTSAGGAGAAPGGSGKGRRHGRRGDASAGTSGPNTAASAASSTGGVGAVGAGGGVGTAKPELAERISAEFRRTLPALRVASKWLLANWGWVGGVAGLSAANWEKTGKGKEKDGGEGNSLEERELRAQRTRFWATYAEFLRRLGRTFPAGLLPKLTEAASGGDSPPQKNGVHVGEGDAAGEDEEQVELELELEEDVDMRGWLPLRGLMGGPCPLPPSLVSAPSTSTATAGEEDDNESQTLTARKRTVGLREEVHPNVEQLMRIADLLRDARQVVALEGSPLALYGGQFVVKGVEAAKPVEGRGVRVGSGIVPTAPPFVPAAVSAAARLHHQVPVDALASIRARAMHDAEDDDAMTEQTSRTDDDILHDAFSFLNQAGSESEGGAAEASDEDEIVWDLR
ncbi:hypothetical protein B0H19DRAFT_547008 [Mycena capillaripes]|nr:hypothetical protein B0H19DRAFT_547008 [Mycena capillaripes]